MITAWRKKTAYELGRTPHHIYLRPHALLRAYIAHYTIWTASPLEQPTGGLLTLVPDASGCVVLDLDQAKASGRLWGATTRAVTVNGGAGGAPVRIFIEFLPGGLFQFTGMGQAAFTDRIFSLGDVMPGFALAVCDLLEIAKDLETLVEGMDNLLLPILLARETPAHAFSAISALQKTRGQLTVEALSEQECYSPRQINRMVSEYLGMGPKQFARLLRVNVAADLLCTGLSLTCLAQESGFYDQAHFIRDFQAVCGITPGKYRENLSDFYNEPLKF